MLNPGMERTLRTVELSGKRLLSLINDILDSASLNKSDGTIVIKKNRVRVCAWSAAGYCNGTWVGQGPEGSSDPRFWFHTVRSSGDSDALL